MVECSPTLSLSEQAQYTAMGKDKILLRSSWEPSFPLGHLSMSSHLQVHGHGLAAGERRPGLDSRVSFSFHLQVLTPSSVPQHVANL